MKRFTIHSAPVRFLVALAITMIAALAACYRVALDVARAIVAGAIEVDQVNQERRRIVGALAQLPTRTEKLAFLDEQQRHKPPYFNLRQRLHLSDEIDGMRHCLKQHRGSRDMRFEG
jgi:hypothetical protein